MVLSVLIVGFFSVLLYEPDPPEGSMAPLGNQASRKDEHPKASTEQSESLQDKGNVEPPRESGEVVTSPGVPSRETSGDVTEPAPKIESNEPAPAEPLPPTPGVSPTPPALPPPTELKASFITKSRAATSLRQPGGEGTQVSPTMKRAYGTSRVEETARPQTPRSEKLEGKPAPKTALASPAPVVREDVSEPGPGFAIARPGETLPDVALRVYGSTDASEVIWRSNRDLLPHRDSPLRAGALLRTPRDENSP
jgi:hypothetical protein